MFFAVSAIAASLVTTGCNSFGLNSSFFKSSGSGEKMDIQKRVILSGSDTPTTRVCAEPSPDAMSSMALEAAGKGGVPSKVQAELSVALQQSAAFVGLRTSSIQLLRDFGYRLCEAYLSGAIDSGEYELLMRRFQKNVVALLAIEQLTGAVKAPPVVLTAQGQAETGQSLSDLRDVREKVNKKIADLEKDKGTKETEKKALTDAVPPKDTKKVVAEIAAIEEEINLRKEDLVAIDKSIASARGTLAQGRTAGLIHSESSPATRSDEAMKAIATVVKDITMAIVKSDDTVQVCLTMLKESRSEKPKPFPEWCKKELELHHAREIYFMNLANEIAIQEKVESDPKSTPEQKSAATEEKNQLKKKQDTVIKGIGVFQSRPLSE
jgi:predicted DNA binding CopG/RHH family protein